MIVKVRGMCHLLPDGMRALRACTADYGHAGRSTWFRGIPDAPDNHSGRPGDRVWPRFPLVLGSGGLSKRRWGFSRPADLKFSTFFERVRLVAGEAASPATRQASRVIGKKLKAAEWKTPGEKKSLNKLEYIIYIRNTRSQ